MIIQMTDTNFDVYAWQEPRIGQRNGYSCMAVGKKTYRLQASMAGYNILNANLVNQLYNPNINDNYVLSFNFKLFGGWRKYGTGNKYRDDVLSTSSFFKNAVLERGSSSKLKSGIAFAPPLVSYTDSNILTFGNISDGLTNPLFTIDVNDYINGDVNLEFLPQGYFNETRLTQAANLKIGDKDYTLFNLSDFGDSKFKINSDNILAQVFTALGGPYISAGTIQYEDKTSIISNNSDLPDGPYESEISSITLDVHFPDIEMFTLDIENYKPVACSATPFYPYLSFYFGNNNLSNYGLMCIIGIDRIR